jgi:hypothetical protein
MKKFLLLLLISISFQGRGQNCPQSGCDISVSIYPDSCATSPQFLFVDAHPFINVCATNLPSQAMPNQVANYCVTSDPSNITNCPSSSYRTATLTAPPGVPFTIGSTTIRSVYFKLRDSTLMNYLGQPTAVGADFKSWLKSPSGTYLVLTGTRPLNTDYSSSTGNYCYCPTFTPFGTYVVPITDGPYNECDYSPDGGSLATFFNGEVTAGQWRLYVADVTDAGGLSFGAARIAEFCMTFEASVSNNATYTWTSDSASWLAYLSNTDSVHTFFTPPSTYYDVTYYVSVYDSAFGCSGTDTVHLYCHNTLSVPALQDNAEFFHADVNHSEITFTYSSQIAKGQIIVLDISGKEVARYVLPANSRELKGKLPQIAAGIYSARLTGENISANVKFAIE